MNVISKEKFIAAAKKGWKVLKFLNKGTYYTDDDGNPVPNRRYATCGCAIGAAAYALKMNPLTLHRILDGQLTGQFYNMQTGDRIAALSDGSRTKESALKKIEKMKW